MSPSVPLQEVDGDAAELLEQFGAEASDLYRALANNPEILETWIAMAWGLRTRARTPRALRELMILRCAQIQGAAYQWMDHVEMGRDAGVREEQIEALASWETSGMFDQRELRVLELTDSMIAGNVGDEVLADLAEEFDPAERVELIVTAGFYCMVPRVLNALRLEPS